MQNQDAAVMVTAQPTTERRSSERKAIMSGTLPIADRLETGVQFVSRWAGVVVLVAAVAAIAWVIL